jgi:hypothetical protein
MDSDMMLGIHMFGDVQAFEQEIANPWHPLSNDQVHDGELTADDILMAETLLAESRGVYAFNRELTGTDEYADLITLIENHYGDWAYRVLDRFTAQALWSLADEHGAHNALEFIEGQEDFTESL